LHDEEDQEEFNRGSTNTFAREGHIISLEDFEIKCVLGKGAFGKVYLTELKSTGQFFAIKSIRKDILIETSSIKSTQLE